MIGQGDSRRAWASLLVLFLLLATLATLQTKWLNEASQAQRERLLGSMQGAAERFALDFDREISGLYVALLSDPRQGELTAASLLARIESWEARSTTSSLLRDLVLLRQQGHAFTSSRLDRDQVRFSAIEMDADLEAIHVLAQHWIDGRGEGLVERNALAASFPILPEVPGLLISLVDMPGFKALRSREDPPAIDFLVARFSRDAIAQALVPALEARHFPLPLWQGYEIAVVDARGDALGSASSPTALGPSEVEQAIFRLLPREQLMHLARDLHPERNAPRHPADRAVAKMGEQLMPRARRLLPPFSHAGRDHVPDSQWRLLVRHPGGSLDAVVKRAHFRNLAISFAVLALLAATAIAFFVSVRRSQMLANRQLEFVAGVSHELRTPVAGIRSLAQNLADGVVVEPEKVREYGQSIEGEGARLADMVEQVLARAGVLSKQTEAIREQIDLREVLELAIVDSKERLRANLLKVQCRIPESLPCLLGNPTTLRRGLRNLIDNAATHGGGTGGSGEIWIRVETKEVAGRREIVLTVEDDGLGIPEDELESVFEPFFRGRRAREHQLVGSGLGLSLVADIAALFEGRILVANRPEGGVVFTLYLPVMPLPLATAESS